MAGRRAEYRRTLRRNHPTGPRDARSRGCSRKVDFLGALTQQSVVHREATFEIALKNSVRVRAEWPRFFEAFGGGVCNVPCQSARSRFQDSRPCARSWFEVTRCHWRTRSGDRSSGALGYGVLGVVGLECQDIICRMAGEQILASKQLPGESNTSSIGSTPRSSGPIP
jgi:hypothetical protein